MKFLLEKGEVSYGRFYNSFDIDELNNDINTGTHKKQKIEKYSKDYKELVMVIKSIESKIKYML